MKYAFLLAILIASQAHAGVGIKSVPITHTPDGGLDSSFPNGDVPPDPVELAWDDPALEAALFAALTRTVGDPQVSVNVRQFLTGDEAATANIVLTQQSPTATSWFTAPDAGNNLLYDCDASPGAASGSWKIRAVGTGGGVTSVSTFNWLCEAAPVGGEIGFVGGIYWQSSRSGQPRDQNYRKNTLYPALFTAGNSAFKGFSMVIDWNEIETTQGNVTAGVNLVNAELDTLRNCPGASPVWCNPDRRLWLWIEIDHQNWTIDNCSDLFPTYIQASPAFGPSVGTGGATPSAYAQRGGCYHKDGSGATGDKTSLYFDQGNAATKAAFFNALTLWIEGLKAGPNWDLIEGFRMNQEYGSDEFGGSGPVSAQEYQDFNEEWAATLRAAAPDKAIIVNALSGMVDKPAFMAEMIAQDTLIGHGDMLPCKANGNTDDCGPNDGPAFSGPAADLELVDFATDLNSELWTAAEGSELGNCAFETYELQDIYDYVNDVMSTIYFMIDTNEQNGQGGTCPTDAQYATGQDQYDDRDHDSNRAAIKAFFEANPTLDNTTPPAHYP